MPPKDETAPTKPAGNVRPPSNGATPTTTSGAAMPSSRTLGRFDLLFEIARGGMGAVHAARLRGPHGFDRPVAIKLLREGFVDDRSRRAFFAEAKLSSRIDHPNVVRTHELGEDDGAPFIVMDLVRGVSLSQLLRALLGNGERLPASLTAWIVAELAAGLHAAHELKGDDGVLLSLVHRDVSPQNVLVSYDGRVYVVDFGIAKYQGGEGSTDTGTVKGKFSYMSPEQARGRTLDRRSDVFSVGIVLHELLTLQRLFAGDSPGESVLKIVQEPIPDPRTKVPDVPDDLAAITMQCLERHPDARFRTALDLERALRKVADPEGGHTLRALMNAHFSSDRIAFDRKLKQAQTDEIRVEQVTTATALASESVTIPKSRTLPILLLLLALSVISVGAWFGLPQLRGADPAPAATGTGVTLPTSSVPVATTIASVSSVTPSASASNVTTPVRSVAAVPSATTSSRPRATTSAVVAPVPSATTSSPNTSLPPP